MIVTVANLKGGTSKTTTAAYLAHALADVGRRVVCIDADPQASLSIWAKYGKWSIPVEEWTGPERADELHAAGWDVVIDTPPTNLARGQVWAALLASTHIVIPMAPTPAEYQRMSAMRELLDDVHATQPRHGAPAAVLVLLVRAVTGTSSVQVYRDVLTEDGWDVLRPTVGRLERYAQAFGGPIERATSSAYGDVIAELSPSLEVRS